MLITRDVRPIKRKVPLEFCASFALRPAELRAVETANVTRVLGAYPSPTHSTWPCTRMQAMQAAGSCLKASPLSIIQHER